MTKEKNISLVLFWHVELFGLPALSLYIIVGACVAGRAGSIVNLLGTDRGTSLIVLCFCRILHAFSSMG